MVRHRQKRGVSPRGESSRTRLSASSSQTDGNPTADSSTNDDVPPFIHVPISTRSSSRNLLSSLTLRSRSRRSGITTRSSRNTPPEVPPPRLPVSPPRRARPLVPPGAVDDDEEDPCSICLDKRTNEAAILYCMHRYCFLCIKRWAEGSNNTCPLCKMIFSEIAYNIRSDTDYDVYKIKHRRSSVFPSRSMLFSSSEYRPFGHRLESGLDLSVTNQGRPEPSYIQLHMARQLGMMEMRGMRGENMMSARVLLYQNDRRSLSMARRVGAAAPTPADFCVNETLIHRLIPFLYREISVVFAIIGNLREAIITNLKHIVRTYPVNDERFSAEVRNVFADGVIGRGATFPSRYVSIFIDELSGFIINNQEIEEFDRLNPALDSQVPRRRHNSPSRHLEMSDLWRRSREYVRSSYVPGPRPTFFPRFLDSNGIVLTSSNSSNSPEDLSSNSRPSFTVSTSSQSYNQEFPPLSGSDPAPAPPQLPYAHPRQSTIESPIWSSLAHENLRERMRLMDSDDDFTLNLMGVHSTSPPSQRLRDRVLRNEEVRASEESPRRNNGASVFTTAGSGERVRAVHITSGPNPLYIRMPLRASYSSIATPSSAAPSEPESLSIPPPPEMAAAYGLPDLQLVPIQPDLTNWPPVSPPLLSPVYDPPSPSMPLLADVEAPQSEPSTSHSPVMPVEPIQKTEKVETKEEPATTSATVPERAPVPVIEISSDEEPVSVSRRRKSKDQRKPRSVRQSRDEDCVILGQSVEIQLSSGEEDVRGDSQEEGGPWRPWQLEQGGPSVPQLIAYKRQRASSASDSTSEDAESSTTTGTSSTEPMQLECGSSVYIHSRQGRRDIRRQKRCLRRRRRYEKNRRTRRPPLSSAVVVPAHSSLAPKQDSGLDELSAQDVSQVLSVIEMSLPEGPTQPKSSFALPQELEQLSASSEPPEAKTIDLTASRTEHQAEVIDLATETKKVVPRAVVRGRRRQELLRRFLRNTARRPDFKRKFPKWREKPQETPLVEVTPKRTKIFVEPVKRKVKAVVERKKKDEEVVDLVVDDDAKPADSEERGTTLRNLEFVYPRTMDEFYRSVRGEAMIEIPSTSASPPSPAKQLTTRQVSSSTDNVTEESRNSGTFTQKTGALAVEVGNSSTSDLDAGSSGTSALEIVTSGTTALEAGNSGISALPAGKSGNSTMKLESSRTSTLEAGNWGASTQVSRNEALEMSSTKRKSKQELSAETTSETTMPHLKRTAVSGLESSPQTTSATSMPQLKRTAVSGLESSSQTTSETSMPHLKRTAVSGLESSSQSTSETSMPQLKRSAVSGLESSSQTTSETTKPQLKRSAVSGLESSSQTTSETTMPQLKRSAVSKPESSSQTIPETKMPQLKRTAVSGLESSSQITSESRMPQLKRTAVSELESSSQTTSETRMPQLKRTEVSGLESSSQTTPDAQGKRTAESKPVFSSQSSPTNQKPKLSPPSSSALDLSRTSVKRKSPHPREISAKLEENLMEVVHKKMRLTGEGDGNGLSPMLERMDIEVAEAKGRVVEAMEVDFDCRHPEPESMEVETGDDAKTRPRPLRRRWRSAEDLTGKKRASVGTQACCRCQKPPTTKTTCTQTESADLASNGVSSTSSFLHGLCAPSSPLSTLDRTSSSSSSFVAVASGSCTPDIDSEVNKDSLGRHLDVCVGSTSILD